MMRQIKQDFRLFRICDLSENSLYVQNYEGREAIVCVFEVINTMRFCGTYLKKGQFR